MSLSTIYSDWIIFYKTTPKFNWRKLTSSGLLSQGYRVISVDIPRAWNNHEWIQAFEKFLDAIDVHHVCSLYVSAYLMATRGVHGAVWFSFYQNQTKPTISVCLVFWHVNTISILMFRVIDKVLINQYMCSSNFTLGIKF